MFKDLFKLYIATQLVKSAVRQEKPDNHYSCGAGFAICMAVIIVLVIAVGMLCF